MGRRHAVAFFLGDASFLADPKFRALARRLPDPDDFNSAVGAYWVALAASRRNGYPAVNFQTETESRFLGDLEAVGLILEDGFPPVSWREWAAKSSFQVAGGIARAESARRNEGGRFTSNTSVASKLVPRSSSPLPSLSSSSSLEEGVQGEKPPVMEAIAYIEERTRRMWSFGAGSKPWETLSADVRDFGWPAVRAAMQSLTSPFPDVAQLVYGASHRLHPIESGKVEGPDPEYVKEQLAERAKRRKNGA